MEAVNRTADTILDRPEKFTIRWIGVNLKFGIKPLKLGTLIYIGKASAQMGEVTIPENVISVIGSARTNARPMSRIIAYSILNSKVGINLFGRLLSGFLLWKLTPKELLTLIQLVIKQSSVTDFFSSTVLAKGISPIIRTVEALKEDKLPGERSQVL